MAVLSLGLGSLPIAKDAKITASLINAIIPDLIKRRTGTVPSLRRTFTVGLSSGEAGLTPSSPPPPYAEPPAPELAQESDSCVDNSRTANDSRYSSPVNSSADDVHWKYVGEGCRLVERARQEAASVGGDQHLTRKMYIDGIGYLLKALPDLSPQESMQLVACLPDSLQACASQPTAEQLQVENADAEANQNNYIYRLVTAMTLYGILLASLLIPFLERCAAAAYRYDRRYRISERALDTSTRGISALAKGAFTSFNEGRSGQMALGMMLYAVDGASRGVLDGYDEALRRRIAVEPQDTENN